MPRLRFSHVDTAVPQLLDCLGLPGAPASESDPFLSLRGECLGEPVDAEWSSDVGESCYQRSWSVGLFAETRFRELRPGVWERCDLLRNQGEDPIVLTAVSSRFDLERGRYQLYSQSGSWCQESQGSWADFSHGRRVLECEDGRTSQGSTPFLGVRRRGSGAGVAFHLLPRGNWRIEAYARQEAGWNAPTLALFLGGDDPAGLQLTLKPGEEYELPNILLVAFDSEHIEEAAPPLHEAMAKRALPLPKPPPMTYNTWLGTFAELDTERLREQLAAAVEVGCEIFVVDAGWYGAGEGWACQGDWQEKKDRAFFGKMGDFADSVRAAGLRFGLWMEPEAIHPSTPLAKAAPDWLFRGPKGMFWIDLTREEGYNWMRDEMSRLLETYQVAWMKIDFNQSLGSDPQRCGLRGYYEAWYRLLAELRKRFPETFFENCGSGAMRLELESYQNYHGHFLSDTVHPVDTIRLLQGTLLRLPAGGIYSWATFAPAGAAPYYPHPATSAPPRTLAPCDATWKHAETVDVGFAMAVAFPGILGLSGDLAGLAPVLRAEIARWVSLWKENRDWLRHSRAHLLTPVQPLEDNTGWAAFELASDDKAVLLAFRLNDPDPLFHTRLRSVDPNASYRISWLDGRGEECRSGLDLLRDGLVCKAGEPFRVCGAILTREGSSRCGANQS